VNRIAIAVAAACLAGLGSARADVKVQERTKVKFGGALGVAMGIAGGSAAKEGLVRSVAVRGDRKLALDESSGELVDLREEKVYRLDVKKRTYEVVTFAEMRKQMQRGAQQAGAGKDEAEERPGKRDEEMQVDVEVRRTGQKRTVAGFQAEQVLVVATVHRKGMTLEEGGGTVLTQDLWLAPGAKARDEVTDFDRRYFEKVYGPEGARALREMAVLAASNPGLSGAMEKLQKEAGKIQGYPVLSALTVESVKRPEAPAEQEEEKPSGMSGLGGFLAKSVAKKVAPRAEPRSVVMESSSELLSLSVAVGDGDVALPVGYKPR
jgi:hypothetical protein